MDVPTWNERDPERIVRTHAHVALASVFLTFLAPLVSWTLWFLDRRLPEARTWKRRLFALAIVDSLLFGALGLATSLAGYDVERTTGREPRIGAVLESREAEEPKGAVVEGVMPDSPAQAAGLEAGDRITAIDGAPVENGSELISEIASTKKGAERKLEVIHRGQRVERVVVPTTRPMAPAREETKLFEPIEVEHELGRTTGKRYVASAGLFELVLVGGLAVAARRRHAPAAPAFAVVSGLIALTLVSSMVLLVFRLTIGMSLGALLLAILSGSVALLLVGLIGAALAPREPVLVGPPLGTAKAVGLGMFYGITGAARTGILLAILVAAFRLPMHSASEAFGLEPSWGALGIGLFVLATVVVAPVAEEVLFRGVLLPWLARWMRPGAALAWTTIVFGIGHLYYGAGALIVALYGFVFGWARLRTGKLRAPIVLHAMLNGATTLALLAAR